MALLDLVCLGVGKGASYVLRGLPSTGFALRVDGRPELLIDCGAGVALSYLRRVGGMFPPRIFISHNHHDHAGDLPVVLSSLVGTRPAVLGDGDVLEIIREHRLHDAAQTRQALIEEVEWVAADGQGRIALDTILSGLSLQLFRSRHFYPCYGFILERGCEDLLGYTADSGFDEEVFKRVTRAPIAIVDGREQGNADHASFEEIEAFAGRMPACSIGVVHYEETTFGFAAPNVRLLEPGDVIPLAL